MMNRIFISKVHKFPKHLQKIIKFVFPRIAVKDDSRWQMKEIS